MTSQALWLLDNETDDRSFERLCTSLMYRWGYRKIVPVGRTADRGRDAEALIFQGEGKGYERVFFQYTLEERWEPKLRNELAKVRRYGHAIDRYVFITRMPVTGAKRDTLARETQGLYGWKLDLYEREWLRHQLEEVNPGLADRYLGTTDLAKGRCADAIVVLPSETEPRSSDIAELLDSRRYEEAIPRLRRLVESSEKPAPQAWGTLA